MIPKCHNVVIFGTGQVAQLAYFYFLHDSPYTVVAFTVDRAHKTEDVLFGLPVVAFEDLVSFYPPSQVMLFIAISYRELNAVRQEKYLAGKALGYHFATYISSSTVAWQTGGIGAPRIGENCFILEQQVIQPFVLIGNNVTLWSRNHIGHHSVIQDHCFLASHVTVSGNVHIEEGCFLGVGATLRNGITVGHHSVIGAGALIMHTVEPYSVYTGVKATKRVEKSTAITL